MAAESEKYFTSKEEITDTIWQQIKMLAIDLRHGSFCCRFVIHDGQIRRAEQFEQVKQIRPYDDK